MKASECLERADEALAQLGESFYRDSRDETREHIRRIRNLIAGTRKNVIALERKTA